MLVQVFARGVKPKRSYNKRELVNQRWVLQVGKQVELLERERGLKTLEVVTLSCNSLDCCLSYRSMTYRSQQNTHNYLKSYSGAND